MGAGGGFAVDTHLTNMLADSAILGSLSSLALLGEFSITGLMESIYNLSKMALGIGFVIFIHELGHFLAAKACGVKCEKFYVGFDPPLKYLPSALFKFQWGETEYGLGIIPLGGYVKMLGQDDNPARAAEEAERSKIVSQDPDGEERVEYDPRSYVAKSVPQRMLIISAGVIMNLISAVFIAAIAYRAGVDIVPVEIAGATPGDPAWVAGMQPGDKIIQIGNRDQDNSDEYLRWRWEFQHEVIKAGITSDDVVLPLDMRIRSLDGEERWEQIKPTDRQKDVLDQVTVGMRAIFSNEIATTQMQDFTSIGAADPPLEAGDRIVAIDGVSLSDQGANEKGILPGNEIEKALVQHVNESLTLTIERTNDETEKTERFDSVIPPSPWKSLGLVMKIGPVSGVRDESPAAEAGFQVGDELVSIQGAPIGNPLTLPFRLPADETLEVVVKRAGKEQTISVQQNLDAWNSHFDSTGAMVGLESIGLAYRVTREVAEVIPNSPAAESGKIKPGDMITTMQLYAEGEDHKQAIERHTKRYNVPMKLDDEVRTWPYIVGWVQQAGPGVDFRVTVERDGSKEEVQLASYDLEGAHYPDRGLLLMPLNRVHTANNWGEAFQLGLRETGEKVREVWNVLTLLVTGRLSMNNLGGPLLIAKVASSEASVGLPRLLLFLTYLSANLALLNFLPIPVLDGGHMVFLTWEGVVGRPVPEWLQQGLTFAGFCCLMALMVFVFANDITRLLGS